MPRLGIVLEKPTVHEIAARKPLHGDVGGILRRTLEAYGVCLDRDVLFSYAVPDPDAQGERWDLIKGERARVMEDMREVDKILCCGALATTACAPLGRIPSMPALHGLGMWTNWPDVPQEQQKYLIPTYSVQKVWASPEVYRDLRHDMAKWLQNDAPLSQPQIEMHLVSSATELRAWLNTLSAYPAIGVDSETTGLNSLSDTLMCLGLSVVTGERTGLGVVIPLNLLYPRNHIIVDMLKDFLGPCSKYTGNIVYQNAKFDLAFLYRYLGEWPFHPNLHDTMLMSYATDERPIGQVKVHGLKDMSRYRLDVPDFKFNFEEFWAKPSEERPWAKLHEYQALDCWCTARLYDILREEMDKEPQLGPMYSGILIPGTKALAQIEAHGILVDVPYLRDMERRLAGKIEEKKKELGDRAAAWGYPNLNPASPAQLAVLLYDKLGLTAPSRSVDKDTLKKARKSKHCTEDIRTFIDDVLYFRSVQKLQSTYVKNLLNLVASDGRFHPNFNVAGTATGRLSSSGGLNMQNLPTHGSTEFKRAFVAPEEHVLIEADLSALELRVSAHFSGEPVWVDAFQRGVDVHRQVASIVFGKEPGQVSYHERYLAKSLDFGCIYGRSARAIAEGRENDFLEEQTGERWSVEAAEQFHDEFTKNLPTLFAWIENYVAECWKTKKTVTPFGRTRRFPLILPFMRGDIERRIFNSLVQSTASDIAFTALIRLHNHLPPGAHILSTIHDSLLIECPIKDMPTVIAMMIHEITHPDLEDRGVPWACDVKTGKAWGTMGEYRGS